MQFKREFFFMNNLIFTYKSYIQIQNAEKNKTFFGGSCQYTVYLHFLPKFYSKYFIISTLCFTEDVSRLITKAECDVSRAFSLRAKFLSNAVKVEEQAKNDDKEAVGQQMKTFVKDLYNKPEVSALGAARGPVGMISRKMS